MQPPAIFHHTLLFLAGAACIFTLNCCAGPMETGDEQASGRSVVLEDMGNGICRQHPSRLMWQIQESQKFATWQEANDYVNALQLGGYDDWRLPTRNECLFLSDLLEIAKGDCPITFTRPHWISNDKKGKPGHWESYPLCGGSEFRWVKGKNGSVRAVRP